MAKTQSKNYRTPPQDLEAEASVLGSIMMDKNAILKVADWLTVQDFYKEAHRKVFEGALALYQKGEPIDFLSLSSMLKSKKYLDDIGGSTFLSNLLNTVATPAHIESYARTIKDKRILRDMISAAGKITELGYQEDRKIEDLVDEAETHVYAVAKQSMKEEFIHLKETLNDAFGRIDTLTKDGGQAYRGVPTGFTQIDHLLSGLQPSDLVILAARPSFGKTTLAMDMARYAAITQNVPVAIFSLEMSKEQIVDRMLASVSGVSLWKLRTGKLSDRGANNDFTKLQSAFSTLQDAPIFIDDAVSSTVFQMKTLARRLQSKHGLGLVIVDYLQLMQAQTRADSRTQEVSEISRGLKALARELNVPVLALSQLSRAVEHRPTQVPRLADLRESGCLTGDTVIHDAVTGESHTMRSLVDSQQMITVWSMNSQLQLVKSKINRAFFSGKKKVYEIKTASGKTIKASANHPFYTIHGWKRLDKLQAGEHLATPRALRNDLSDNSAFTRHQLTLLAHLIGDGCYLRRQPLHCTNSDKQNISIVTIAAQSAFDVKTRIIKQDNWYHVYMSGKRRGYNPIREWLKELDIYDQRSRQKVLPKQLFKCSDRQIAYFLQHLWSTDGSIVAQHDKRRGTINHRIYYATGSITLAKQIQHLLLRFEIRARIKNVKKAGYKDWYSIDISGSQDKLLFVSNIGVFGQKHEQVSAALEYLPHITRNTNVDVVPREAWQAIESERIRQGMSTRQFHAYMGWAYSGTQRLKNNISRTRMRHIVERMPVEGLLNLAFSDLFWDRIVSITPLGIEDVYDLTVPDTHNFVAQDIIVHNSIEQDADVVMFIYREDKVKENSDRPNIADIYIAKHRNGPTGKAELYFDAENVRYTNLDTSHADQAVHAGSHMDIPQPSVGDLRRQAGGKSDDGDSFEDIISDLQ